MNSTKRDQYVGQKIDIEEVIVSHSNLVKKLLGTSMVGQVMPLR